MNTEDSWTPQHSSTAPGSGSEGSRQMKECSYCASTIPVVALVCRYCRRGQPGTVVARWAMESPVKWVNLFVALVASAAFGMGVLSLLAIGALNSDRSTFPDTLGLGLWPTAAESDRDFETFIARRREWRDGETVPMLDSRGLPLGFDRPREVELSSEEVAQLSLNIVVGATYRVAAEGVGGFDPYLYLFQLDEDGGMRLVNSDDDGGEGVNALISETLTPGEYIVVVEGFGGGSGQCVVRVTRAE